jgi:predicted amino acid-binding ACT domain protein
MSLLIKRHTGLHKSFHTILLKLNLQIPNISLTVIFNFTYYFVFVARPTSHSTRTEGSFHRGEAAGHENDYSSDAEVINALNYMSNPLRTFIM